VCIIVVIIFITVLYFRNKADTKGRKKTRAHTKQLNSIYIKLVKQSSNAIDLNEDCG